MKHQILFIRTFLALVLCLIFVWPSALAQRPPAPSLEIGRPALAQPTSLEMTRQEAEAAALAIAWECMGPEAAENGRMESELFDYPDAPGHPFWSIKMYEWGEGSEARGINARDPYFYLEMDARTGEPYSYGDNGADAHSYVDEEYYRRLRGAEWVWGPSENWSLEQLASFDAWALALGFFEGDYFRSLGGLDILPGPEDLPMEEALRIARQGIADKYGLDEARFEHLAVFPRFKEDIMLGVNDELTSYWVFVFGPKPGDRLEEEWWYYAQISNPSGALLDVDAEKEADE